MCVGRRRAVDVGALLGRGRSCGMAWVVRGGGVSGAVVVVVGVVCVVVVVVVVVVAAALLLLLLLLLLCRNFEMLVRHGQLTVIIFLFSLKAGLQNHPTSAILQFFDFFLFYDKSIYVIRIVYTHCVPPKSDPLIKRLYRYYPESYQTK